MHVNAGLLIRLGLCAATFACRSDGTGPPAPPPPPPPGTHVGYYVYPPPYGTSGGTGTTYDPWDLATALEGGNGNVIQPGDTVWIRGGTYPGSFRTALQGTAAAPILFRQYPGERATIDGSLRADGAFLTFWGFEIMQSHPLLVVDRVLEAYTSNGRFINLMLHDAGFSGVDMSPDAGSGLELYGSIVYNNGWREDIDHGVYASNATAGTKYITDNVFFNNYARGIQVYEDGGLIRNVEVSGNVSFNNGTISSSSTEVNLLISASVVTSGMIARDNLLYYSPGVGKTQVRLGNYDTSDSALYNKDIVVENNFAVGGTIGLEMQYQWAQATVQNNTFVGGGSTDVVRTGGPSVNIYTWSGNTYYRDPTAAAWEQNGTAYSFNDWRTATGLGASDQASAGIPPATRVFVRPNRYEPGRAFIAVYNFAGQNPVSVDLSGVVALGHRYEVRNVQDVFGPPVASGTYAGGAVAILMDGVQPPAVIGRTAPRSAPKTGPDFDVFLLTSSAP